MKKSVLFCLLILAFQTNYSFAQSINSEKEDNWIIGKWYPAYFYYDDGEGNEVKKEFDLCITEAYLEFYVKNKKLISHKSYLNTVRNLEYFHFVFTAICSSRASGLESKYSSFARKIRSSTDQNITNNILQEMIASLNKLIPMVIYIYGA